MTSLERKWNRMSSGIHSEIKDGLESRFEILNPSAMDLLYFLCGESRNMKSWELGHDLMFDIVDFVFPPMSGVSRIYTL